MGVGVGVGVKVGVGVGVDVGGRVGAGVWVASRLPRAPGVEVGLDGLEVGFLVAVGLRRVGRACTSAGGAEGGAARAGMVSQSDARNHDHNQM